MEDVKNEADIIQPEIVMPVRNTYGLRINFMGNKGAKGACMRFEFSDEGTPAEIAEEMNCFIQNKVELLSIKTDDKVNEAGEIVKGKRPFRASDVLPRRKATLDVVYNGALVKSSLMGVPCYPYQFFDNGGELFHKLIAVLVKQSHVAIEKKQTKVAMLGI